VSRDCPVCGCAQKRQLYVQNFRNNEISLMEKYNVAVCKKCGFIYADNIPPQAEFDNYYARMSKYEFNNNSGAVPAENMAHFRKIVNFLIPHIKHPCAKILDIGCSTGALLSVLKTRGYRDLEGIDPSPSCAKAAKKIYGINVTSNNIASYKGKEKFGLVILSSVFEHLVDLKAPMQKIHNLLDENGLVFLEVPDTERFDKYIYPPFQQFSIEHINYFSRYSIGNLASRFSFSIAAVKRNENKARKNIDPVLFVLLKKTGKSDIKTVKDNISARKIKSYIAGCSKLDLRVRRAIHSKLSGRNKIIVWGAGTHTQRLIGSALDLSKISFFVDSNLRYAGKKLRGISIKPPAEIRGESLPILVSTYGYQEEIIRQIRRVFKLKNEIISIYQ